MEGVDCVCMAHHENECGCGADWTTSEFAWLLEEVKQLKAQIVILKEQDFDGS